MQGSSNNSFIPKRRDLKRKSTGPTRKIFLLTIIAYSVLFATLLAAAGTVFYKNYTAAQLENEVKLLDVEVNTFSVQDFKQVQEFDTRLQAAQGRVDASVSTVAILDEIDRVTAQPIQINSLKTERQGDQSISVILNFSTETLDAALFQRKELNLSSPLFSDVEISEVDLQSSLESADDEESDVIPVVTFLAEFTVPVGFALYDPAGARLPDLGTFMVPSEQNEFINSIDEVDQVDALESDQDVINSGETVQNQVNPLTI